jgi:hypothetical protein
VTVGDRTVGGEQVAGADMPASEAMGAVGFRQSCRGKG